MGASAVTVERPVIKNTTGPLTAINARNARPDAKTHILGRNVNAPSAAKRVMRDTTGLRIVRSAQCAGSCVRIVIVGMAASARLAEKSATKNINGTVASVFVVGGVAIKNTTGLVAGAPVVKAFATRGITGLAVSVSIAMKNVMKNTAGLVACVPVARKHEMKDMKYTRLAAKNAARSIRLPRWTNYLIRSASVVKKTVANSRVFVKALGGFFTCEVDMT